MIGQNSYDQQASSWLMPIPQVKAMHCDLGPWKQTCLSALRAEEVVQK